MNKMSQLHEYLAISSIHVPWIQGELIHSFISEKGYAKLIHGKEKLIKNCQDMTSLRTRNKLFFISELLEKKCVTTIHNMTETFVNNSKIT